MALRGAVDLGAIAAQREAAQRAASAPPPTALVIDVTEETFAAEVVDRSMTVPVVVDLWATWCGPCTTLSPILERLTAEYAGRFVLAKIDVDAEQQIAAAFQVQSIPTVMAVVKGQPVPLFQGALPEPQVRAYLDELLKVAARVGVSGTVTAGSADVDLPDGSVDGSAESAADEAPLDPRYAAAYDAIEAGDWAAAETAYAAVLNAYPADEDARAGVALAQLMQRVEVSMRADADPASYEGRLAAADAAAASGAMESAFALLVQVVRDTSGDDRERARQRLLDLFLIAGDDPAVPPARLALANALF